MSASTKEIKGKIESVENIQQITRAMQLMSVSKMRRAVDRVAPTRRYADRAREILENLSADQNITHPLMEYGDGNAVLAVVVASDKGLCGSFNAKIQKRLEKFKESANESPVDVVAVGDHAAGSAEILECDLVGTFNEFNEHVSISDVSGIFELVRSEFHSGTYNRVVVIYSHYESALEFTPLVRQLLPVDPDNMGDTLDEVAEAAGEETVSRESMSQYIFEPSESAVVSAVLPRFSQVRLFQALMESQASEHSARMFAMKNATENAEEVAEELEISYNRARQDAITREISEISAGANALSD